VLEKTQTLIMRRFLNLWHEEFYMKVSN